MTEIKTSEDAIVIDRRTVLYGAAAVAATTALAACSSASGSAAPASSSIDKSSTADAIGSATASVEATGKASSAAPTDAAAAENGIGKASAIAVGGGVIFTHEKVVVTQPTAGVYKAFTAVCTHQGCTVASVDNGKIVCPCHGSEFSIKDGSVVTGPATVALKAEKVTVTGGTIKLG